MGCDGRINESVNNRVYIHSIISTSPLNANIYCSVITWALICIYFNLTPHWIITLLR